MSVQGTMPHDRPPPRVHPDDAMRPVRHPIFARFYERFAAADEAKGAATHRQVLLAGLAGRVIEPGAGQGLNFHHYPRTVTEVLAVEPEPYLRTLAGKAAADAAIPIRVMDGTAEALPAEDASFDAGVVSLVLCTVPDQDRALAELYRVIRPGGELRFYEHIRSHRPGFARFQRALDVIWPHVAGGCHASRATDAAIARAGFVIEQRQEFSFRSSIVVAPLAPHILGIARRS